MAVLLDAGFPVVSVDSASGSTRTSAAFSTGANRFVVCIVSSGWTAAQAPIGFADSSLLSWTKGHEFYNTSGGSGVQLWYAYTSSPLASDTITLTLPGIVSDVVQFAVLSFTGVLPLAPLGAKGTKDNGFDTNGAVPLGPVGGGDPYLLYAAQSQGSNTALALGGSDILTFIGTSLAVGHYLTPVASGYSTTLGVTFGSACRIAGIAVEILAGSTVAEQAVPGDSVAVYGPITILPQTDFQSAFQPAAFQEYGFGAAGPATYTVNDSATAQDAVAEAQAFTASLSDAAMPGEATALAQRFALSLANGATPGEATAIRAAYAQTLADACQALDDFATATAQGSSGDSAAVADGATPGDVVSVAQGLSVAFAEGATALDALALKAAAAAVLADSCAPGEAFATASASAGAATGSLSDSCLPGEAFAIAMAYAVAFEDGCAARDRAAQSTGAVGPATPTHAGGTLRLGGTLRAKGTLRGKL